ncbi:hypothetical protein RI367_003410 [Sorochytrium milnesiophthora]
MHSLLSKLHLSRGGSSSSSKAASSSVSLDPPPAYDAIGVPQTLLRRLPKPVVSHITALAGVRVCAILQDLSALQSIVDHHLNVTGRSRRKEKEAMRLCVEHHWSAGVQLLIDSGFEHVLLQWPERHDLKPITLTPMAIRMLWRYRNDMPNDAFACLVANTYLQATDSKNPADNIARWCCERSRPFLLDLGEELIRRGSDFGRLRALYQQAEVYIDDRDLAWRFIRIAARHGRLDLVHTMDLVCPEALQAQEEPFVAAAASDSVNVLRFVHDKSHRRDFVKAMTAAVANSREQVFVWLNKHRPRGQQQYNLVQATACKRVDLFKQLWDITAHDKDKDKQALLLSELAYAACANDSADVLAWLLAKSPAAVPQWLPPAIVARLSLPTFRCLAKYESDLRRASLSVTAAQCERWDLVQYAGETYPRACPVELIVQAVGRGRLDVARVLCDRLKMNLASLERLHYRDVARVMAHSGRLAALQALHRQTPIEVDQSYMTHAVSDGNSGLVRWAYEQNPSIRLDGPLLSVMLDNCDYATAQRAMLTPNASSNASKLREYEEILSRVHDARLAALRSPSSVAAARELDLSVYRQQHHRDIDCSEAMDVAAASGDLDAVIWLHEEQYKRCTTQAMDSAAINGHLHIVSWLHSNRTEGCTTAAMTGACKHQYLDVARFLHEHRQEGCSPTAMDHAVEDGAIDVVRWLHENRTERWSPRLMKTAAMRGHLPVVQFLHEHGYERCTDADIKDAPAHVKEWFKSMWAK